LLPLVVQLAVVVSPLVGLALALAPAMLSARCGAAHRAGGSGLMSGHLRFVSRGKFRIQI
jgi:hypothetical protein